MSVDLPEELAMLKETVRHFVDRGQDTRGGISRLLVDMDTPDEPAARFHPSPRV